MKKKEEIIKCLENGECPFCGKKNLKKPLIHINHMHGYTSREIHDYLGIAIDKGFSANDTKKKHKHIAEKQGFGIEIRPKKILNEKERIEKGKRISQKKKMQFSNMTKAERVLRAKKSFENVDRKAVSKKLFENKEHKKMVTENILKAAEKFREDNPNWHKERFRGYYERKRKEAGITDEFLKIFCDKLCEFQNMPRAASYFNMSLGNARTRYKIAQEKGMITNESTNTRKPMYKTIIRK